MKFVANRITALAYTALLAFAANAQELWESAQAPGNVFVVKQFYTDTANDAMYAVGEVNVSGGNGGGNNSIMRYTSAGWDTLGHFDNMIFSIVTWHDTLIVGGGFEFVNGIPAISLAAYANGQWMPYGDIGYTSVFKLRILDNELYMVGSFEIADGHVSTGVAKRVGSEWVNVGIINDPYDKLLFDIAKYNGELIVTGIMAVPGENGGIMRYDGTNWHQLGSGLVGAGGQCLSVYKGELYVGGSFLIPQNIGQGIMRWNGSEWRNTGVGPTDQRQLPMEFNRLDMFIHNDLLWVAGYFRYASGVPAHF
ncbi:MAG: hypothetical protein IPO90_07935 [Flavobacteriales bacterium]|nr:hypothetical protein [Flavobacteriales bacterium]